MRVPNPPPERISEARIRLQAIAAWVEHALHDRCTEAEAFEAVVRLAHAGRTFTEEAA